jgi:hypothetical protein
MEAPDGGEPISSLPSFTPVVFITAFGCGLDRYVGDPENGDAWTIVDASSQALTATTLGDDSVTITFEG